jgi:NADH-quinone oxidoreductase subunit N
MSSDFTGLIPPMLLAAGGFLIFCAGAFWRHRPSWLFFALALSTSAAAGILSGVLEPPAPDFMQRLDLTGYGRYFSTLLCAVTVFTLLFVRQYSRIRGFGADEFYGLILYAALGMVLTAGALNWLIFFLGLEVLSLSLYIIIAVRKAIPASSEAALKYFILGAVASAFLTFGIAMQYAATGTLDIVKSVAVDAHANPLLLLGFGLILVGIGFKISLVPFHLWTPDVYQGAPAPVTAFLATGSKVALFGALLRFALDASDALWVYCFPALYIFSVLNMLVGNLSALGQSRVKRMLAYSSIAQMGYVMMALVAIREDAVLAVLFYLAIYAVMDLGAFGVLGLLSEETTDLDTLEDLRGLGYAYPWHGALLSICLLSLAGLPPTGGFIGKFIIFKFVIQANFVALAIMGILAVIISIFYYLKVIVALYMQPQERETVFPVLDFWGRAAIAVVLFVILWLGVAPAPFLGLITNMISAL